MRGCRGNPADAAFVMQDGARADEPDAGNDLRGNARVVANAELFCQFSGENGEHGRAEADKYIGAQPGRLALELALQPDDPPSNAASVSRTMVFDSRSSMVMCGKARAEYVHWPPCPIR